MTDRTYRIRIITESTGPIDAELITNKNPNTVEAIFKALPIDSVAMTWGDEVYFSTPVSVGPENTDEVVEKGDIAYWPPGRALCIFFGPTPASRTPDEIRPASPVNVIGKVLGNPRVFRKVKDGERIRVEKV